MEGCRPCWIVTRGEGVSRLISLIANRLACRPSDLLTRRRDCCRYEPSRLYRTSPKTPNRRPSKVRTIMVSSSRQRTLTVPCGSWNSVDDWPPNWLFQVSSATLLTASCVGSSTTGAPGATNAAGLTRSPESWPRMSGLGRVPSALAAHQNSSSFDPETAGCTGAGRPSALSTEAASLVCNLISGGRVSER